MDEPGGQRDAQSVLTSDADKKRGTLLLGSSSCSKSYCNVMLSKQLQMHGSIAVHCWIHK